MAESKPSRNKEVGEFLMALAILLLSAFFAYNSLIMERPEGWGTAPGLLPLFLGSTLFIMSGIILLGSIRRGGLRLLLAAGGKGEGAGFSRFIRANWRPLVVIAAVAVFYFGLLRFLPFEISTIAFFIFMTGLYWTDANWKKRLAVSIAVPLVISVIFQAGFGIPLPGEGNLIEILVYSLR